MFSRSVCSRSKDIAFLFATRDLKRPDVYRINANQIRISLTSEFKIINSQFIKDGVLAIARARVLVTIKDGGIIELENTTSSAVEVERPRVLQQR
jgi:hypothetical protein